MTTQFVPRTERLAVRIVRFEPNARGRFLSTRVSLVGLANSNVTSVDLNPHINYGVPAGSDAERANSLALPGDIVRAADGTLYVAATGSAKVGVLNSTGVQARINVGQGPTGLALNQAGNLLYGSFGRGQVDAGRGVGATRPRLVN